MPQVVIQYKEETYTANVAEGLSVLIAATMAGLDAFGFGDCGGNLVCATCHVRVNSGTFPPMKQDEELMLGTLPHVYPNSRLACQLRVGAGCNVTWLGGR